MDDFRAWILRAYPEVTGDVVSHLAGEIKDDDCWPEDTRTEHQVIEHLDRHGAVSEAYEAAGQAWLRYEQWCKEQA